MADKSFDRSSERAYLPPSAPPTNHGHTTAAWTTVILVLVGAVVASLAVMGSLVWLFWVGLGIVLLGVIVGRVLKMLGFGQPGPSTDSRDTAHSGS
ncbi:HGxxPAAW family protein [Actinotalea sp. K2]|uniref:HGxxPAAW family protein n=1 Tax=Actinotalea sp. K2 TaxID=2939438 RepID=UPI0020177253|nr:HGxxPAAW family protein [Actinotalea sp. K2]MCL3861878.1 hypothetical protein [Actinotalea sp. K2]